MQIYSFKIGDPSSDGHGISHEYNFALKFPDGREVTDDELRSSLVSAQAALGFDVSDLCEEYEQFSLLESQWAAMQAAGFERPENSLERSGREMAVPNDPYGREPGVGVADFIAWCLRYSLPDLQVELMHFKSLESLGLDSFGYGLFGQ